LALAQRTIQPKPTSKEILDGTIMRIGGMFSGLFKSTEGEQWETTPNSEDPEKWKPEGNMQLATFGAGCYWGTEKYFANDFAKMYPEGAIKGTSVGFMSPDPKAMKNPNYMQVCSGATGHVEVLHILYDSSFVKYEDMVKFFFTFHDPTTLNK